MKGADMDDAVSTMGLRVRAYEPGDELAINHRFNEVFNCRRPLAEWRGKYGEIGRESLIFVVVDESGDVYAHYAVLLVPFWIRGSVRWMAQTVDIFAVRSSSMIFGNWFRRLSSHVVEHLLARGDVLAMYGFPGERSGRLGMSRGWYPTGEPMMVWRLPREFAGQVIVGGRRLSRSCPDRQQADKLWKEVAGTDYCGVVRDGEWLQKRYDRVRGGSQMFKIYKVRRSLLSRRLSAWGVFVRFGDDILWLDFLWDGREEADLDMIVCAAARDFAAGSVGGIGPGVQMWYLGGGGMGNWLDRRGWQAGPHVGGMVVSVRSLTDEVQHGELFSMLYINAGDSDLW